MRRFLPFQPQSPCNSQELAEYWQNTFDWRKAEASLNSFANFDMSVNGIDLHFIHERSSDPDAIPILLSHGWPGSVFEFHKIIPKLTNPGESSHLHCPACPAGATAIELFMLGDVRQRVVIPSTLVPSATRAVKGPY